MSAAPAPARKPASNDTAPARSYLKEFAAELGCKFLDPIPADQYRYFLGKKEAPLQRLLALVRSKTIGQRDERGRRFSHCVDEHGKELRLADLRRLLGMDWGNFNRTVIEAKARGLIRVGNTREGGYSRVHDHRVYLAGSLTESVGYREQEKGGTSLYRLVLLTPAQRKIYDGWGPEKQARFYADFESAVKEKEKIEREALARARKISAPLIDRVLTAHALPVKRLKSVQTQSVPTRETESVPAAASLLTQRTTREEEESVGRSLLEPPAHTATESADRPASILDVKALLLEEYGRHFPGDSPSVPLCQNVLNALAGAPLELLRARMRQRLASAKGFGFTLSLSQGVGVSWIEGAVERERAAAKRREQERGEREFARQVAQKTLADPRAGDEEKALARDILESQKSTDAGGGR